MRKVLFIFGCYNIVNGYSSSGKKSFVFHTQTEYLVKFSELEIDSQPFAILIAFWSKGHVQKDKSKHKELGQL